VGMIPACTLMWKVWFLVHDWLRALSVRTFGTASKRISIATGLGCIGAFLLIVASSVISPNPMPWGVHIFGATGKLTLHGAAVLVVAVVCVCVYVCVCLFV
jgi:hypothetical protein